MLRFIIESSYCEDRSLQNTLEALKSWFLPKLKNVHPNLLSVTASVKLCRWMAVN